MASADLAAPDTAGKGAWILRVALAGTVIFAASAFGAVATESLRGEAAVAAGVLFAIGIVTFLAAYVVAIARSREVVLGVGGIYFLSGSAPRPVRIRLLGALAAQVVIAMITASIRPYTSLAFGLLVPMFGLGMTGLWGALHGMYPERRERSANVPVDE